MGKFLLYFIIISVLTILVTVYDKKISKKQGKRRISEKALIILAIMGGCIAEYLTMLKIRHKTKHLKFMLLLPLMIVFHLVLLFFILEFGETYYSSFLDFFR